MALTFEQFQTLRKKGLSVEQIARFETASQPKVPPTSQGNTGLKGFGTGFVKGRLENLQNLGKSILRPFEAGINAVAGKKIVDAGQTGVDPKLFERHGTAEKAGNVVGEIAEFAVPGSKITKVGKAAQTAVKGTSLASKTLGLGARAGVEAVGGAGAAAYQGRDAKDVRDAGIISAAFPAAGALLKQGKALTSSMARKAAPRIVDSLIKPLLKDLSYGKNPGRAVAEMGITANSLDELGTKIGEAKRQVGQSIRTALKNNSGRAKSLDLTDALQPIDDALVQAQNSPRTNAALINRLQDAKADLLKVSTNEAGETIIGRTLKGITAEEAFEFKSLVSDITKFTGNASDDALVNKALKQVYGRTKEKINTAVPGLSRLNERYADLSSAEIATKYRDKIMERQNLISFGQTTTGLGAALVTAITSGGAAIPSIIAGASVAGLHKALGTPAVKTRVAAWLAQASPEEKRRLFSAAPALKAAIIQSLVGEEEIEKF